MPSRGVTAYEIWRITTDPKSRLDGKARTFSKMSKPLKKHVIPNFMKRKKELVKRGRKMIRGQAQTDTILLENYPKEKIVSKKLVARMHRQSWNPNMHSFAEFPRVRRHSRRIGDTRTDIFFTNEQSTKRERVKPRGKKKILIKVVNPNVMLNRTGDDEYEFGTNKKRSYIGASNHIRIFDEVQMDPPPHQRETFVNIFGNVMK